MQRFGWRSTDRNFLEANRFLVRGLASYRGGKHEVLLNNWQAGLRTAESIRIGAPQAKLDFAGASAATSSTTRVSPLWAR